MFFMRSKGFLPGRCRHMYLLLIQDFLTIVSPVIAWIFVYFDAMPWIKYEKMKEG